MQNEPISRRTLIRTAGLSLSASALQGAPPFWNRKAPQEWSSEEIAQLMSRSPWARETNLDFEATEGGRVEAVPNGAPPQPGEYVPRPEAGPGPMTRTPVTVRWESAKAIRDAMQVPLNRAFEGRYAIGVSNIPPGAMTRHRIGKRDVEPAPEELLAELQGAATLEVPGREPAGAGLVRHVAGSENNYIFGFSKDLLPLTGKEREILFVLRTARVSVKARFEPKNMIYRGKFAV